MKGANTSYAGALNQNSMSQIKGKIKLPLRQHESVDGKTVVIFTKEEQELLATTCKWTFVGKFLKTHPQIDKIKADFVKIVPLRGSVKIGVKDLKHVFIDVDNEEDYNIINSKNFINLSEDNNMKIQKWTIKFKPEEETTLSSVWINLLDLPWHFYEWAALCTFVSPIGTPIVMDKATLSKTRPTTVKVRVEIDLTETLVHEVTVEIRNSTGEIEVFIQKIE
ncbi:hypothetical protein KY285_013369 [Solanum tuberosum]|nr:hypothetical protein KY289_014057 [Solanum tuberosum]KAH0717338.1 hypothetical protein KY285_013369 [Solanum tuberosum]